MEEERGLQKQEEEELQELRVSDVEDVEVAEVEIPEVEVPEVEVLSPKDSPRKTNFFEIVYRNETGQDEVIMELQNDGDAEDAEWSPEHSRKSPRKRRRKESEPKKPESDFQ